MSKIITDVSIVKMKKSLEQKKFQELWEDYVLDYISDYNYRQEIYKMINEIRNEFNYPLLTELEFDKTWQFLILGSEEFEVAFAHMIQAIYQQY